MPKEHGLKEGISGVRGVVGKNLTVQTALEYGLAAAKWFKGKTIALGRDTRTSGPMLSHAVIAGLLQGGKDVVDLGVLPVPGFQTAIRLNENYSGGVYITASHNPGDQNGLKFFRPDGIILYPTQAADLIALRASQDFTPVPVTKTGTLSEQSGALEAHVKRIAGLVDCELIKQAGLHVVVDCNNGSACDASPLLLEMLGVIKFEIINGIPDGKFAHKPEPVPQHMKQLAQAVSEGNYHVGFAQDPDADRVSIAACVSKQNVVKGMAIGEEYTLALAAAAVAEQARQSSYAVSMACNQSTSRMIEEIALANGFPFRRTPVGEINVVEGLQALERDWKRKHKGDMRHFAFGGEGGGGVIDPRNQYCRDSLNAIALILQGLAAFKIKQLLPEAPRPGDERLLLDAWCKAALPPCAIYKTSVSFEDTDMQMQALARIKQELSARAISPDDLMTDDGIRLRLPDKSWMHVRSSNTEPIVRFIAEHDTLSEAKKLVDEIMKLSA